MTLFFNLPQGRAVAAQTDLYQPPTAWRENTLGLVRRRSPEIQAHQFRVHVVEPVAVIVGGVSFLGPLKIYVLYRCTYGGDQLLSHQLYTHRLGRSDPRVPAIHRDLGEDVKETVYVVQAAAQIGD